MKYAIFSDIHGNFPALEAALSDAKKKGADKFLFLGDYYSLFPWGNEVAELIRGLEDSAVVICGNGENRLINLRTQNQAEWTHEQFKMLYWSYQALKPENLEYLTTLPESTVVSDNGINIYLAHSISLPPKIRLKYFHSLSFRALMEEAPFSHEEYLALAREELLSQPDALEAIDSLPEGIYLFGHNHLQFHMEYKGRIFINPGSCGVACDFDTSAAYTLLEQTDGEWHIIEKRVEYDIDTTAQSLRSSDFNAQAPVWSRIIERQLKTGKEGLGCFVRHLIATAKELGQGEKVPVSNDVWEAAVLTWRDENV